MIRTIINVPVLTEQYANDYWLAWTDSDKIKLVTDGKTEQQAINELQISLKVKIACDYNLPLCSQQ